MSMQTFYSSLFTPQTASMKLRKLFAVASASLKEVLAVRSELAWEDWGVE